MLVVVFVDPWIMTLEEQDLSSHDHMITIMSGDN